MPQERVELPLRPVVFRVDDLAKKTQQHRRERCTHDKKGGSRQGSASDARFLTWARRAVGGRLSDLCRAH